MYYTSDVVLSSHILNVLDQSGASEKYCVHVVSEVIQLKLYTVV